MGVSNVAGPLAVARAVGARNDLGMRLMKEDQEMVLALVAMLEEAVALGKRPAPPPGTGIVADVTA